jgi:hypothetical protein
MAAKKKAAKKAKSARPHGTSPGPERPPAPKKKK